MTKEYTARELITAQLNGLIIQKQMADDTWHDTDYIFACKTNEFDDVIDHYRIKPKELTVRYCNGVELPQCVTEPLEKGDKYFIPAPNGKDSIDKFITCIWEGYDLELIWLKAGLIYIDLRNAITHAKAMLKTELRVIEDE